MRSSFLGDFDLAILFMLGMPVQVIVGKNKSPKRVLRPNSGERFRDYDNTRLSKGFEGCANI